MGSSEVNQQSLQELTK